MVIMWPEALGTPPQQVGRAADTRHAPRWSHPETPWDGPAPRCIAHGPYGVPPCRGGTAHHTPSTEITAYTERYIEGRPFPWPLRLLALTSEARRARPHLRSWSRGPPPSGLSYGAAACIGTCACKKRRTRSIVRCFSSSGSFHGYTVISAFGASEATSIEVCSGCAGTSSGSTSIAVWQCRMKSRDTLYRKSGCTA